jgi:hypothetical protein
MLTRLWAARWRNRSLIPCESKRVLYFKIYSRWVWSPPKLLIRGNRGSFPREVSDLGWKLTTDRHLTPGLRMSAVTPLVLYRTVCSNLQHVAYLIILGYYLLRNGCGGKRREPQCPYENFGMMPSNILRPRKQRIPHFLQLQVPGWGSKCASLREYC